MSRTTILLGPPGTGKTTRLIKEVDTALKETSPDRIAYFAFTKKAASEAVSRASEKFNLDPDDLFWFRTLHSAAFAILGLSREDVMKTEDYTALGKALGSFTFDFSYDEGMERAPQGGALGDRCLGIYSNARARGITVEEEWRSRDYDDTSLRDAKRFSQALEEYKRAFLLRDFSDFLDDVEHPLDIDLLIIDEAQDLTYQQWAFARRIGAQAKKVLIAGDDDQAIFQWAGADLRTFLSLAGRVEVLPTSYRLPRRIWGLCDSVTRRIRVRRPKVWRPREDEGLITHLMHPEQVDLRDGKSWLLLARNRYQLPLFERICRSQGVVYMHEGHWSNRTPEVRSAVLYERLRNGGTVPPREVGVVTRFISGMSAPNKGLEEYSWDNFPWPFEGRPDWIHALNAMGFDEREYIRRLRREGESLTDPGRVSISTIHGIKGGEADNVLLVPDVSRRVAEGMLRDPDQEARVWYVAASRAREALHLVVPRSNKFFQY